MKVFRIQDADGRGPFRPGFSPRWIEKDSSIQPPDETVFDLLQVSELLTLDSLLHHGTGCTSLLQLKTWFTPAEVKRLRHFGYFPVQLEVDHIVAAGKHQVLFSCISPLKEHAKLIDWETGEVL